MCWPDLYFFFLKREKRENRDIEVQGVSLKLSKKQICVSVLQENEQKLIEKVSPVCPKFKENIQELLKTIECSGQILFLVEKMEELEGRGFGPEPSIHSKGAIKFQREILKANDWVLETLENGLSLGRGTKFPNEHFEKNNKSAVENMDRLREKFLDYEREGKIERLKERPRICNPLSVVEKGYGENKKFRPVIDQSRCVNLFLPKEGTKLNDLAFFEPFFEQNAYMCSYDLKAMYHQLRLSEKTKDLFGCSILDENGREIFFRFVVLAFGNSRAVFTMTKLLGTTEDFFRHMGIHTGVFIDDGLLVHKDKVVLKMQNWFVHKVLRMAGWVRQDLRKKRLWNPPKGCCTRVLSLTWSGWNIASQRIRGHTL